MPSERTPRGYPLPHPEHLLSDDVLHLREAFTRIDADVAAQAQALDATTQVMAGVLDEEIGALQQALRRERLRRWLNL